MPNPIKLISHNLSQGDIQKTVDHISERINASDMPMADKQMQLNLLEQMQEFDFGRFLLLNSGINGFWTHYMLTYPWYGKKTQESSNGRALTPLEKKLLEEAPVLLATQERFELFLEENQKSVQSGSTLACIPCGMMGELLYLNYENASNYKLVGIDLDADTFTDATRLSESRNLQSHVDYIQCDAWEMDIKNEFDLISSNGLNIYQSDTAQIIALYQKFYQALKLGGRLVTSFLTPPPLLSKDSEWDMNFISTEALLMQKVLFSDVIQGKWQQAYQTSIQTRQQLESVGFKDIEFRYDKARIFPTVIARKTNNGI